MGVIFNRVRVITTYLSERSRYGLPEAAGPLDREVLFLLDGVGGLQAGPLMVRRALRNTDAGTLGTILFTWQYGVPGEIWTDLMWLRRNRVMGAKLAAKLLAFRRTHPKTVIHVVAFSGGAGIAVFACERLRGPRLIETLILACPALSPAYNLGPALQAVERCYALVSHRDTWILGFGTGIFGTVDRCFSSAAGQLGFRIPVGISPEDACAYERLREIRWSPVLGQVGHHGGHTGWAGTAFLRRFLPEMLRGEVSVPLHKVQPA